MVGTTSDRISARAQDINPLPTAEASSEFLSGLFVLSVLSLPLSSLPFCALAPRSVTLSYYRSYSYYRSPHHTMPPRAAATARCVDSAHTVSQIIDLPHLVVPRPPLPRQTRQLLALLLLVRLLPRAGEVPLLVLLLVGRPLRRAHPRSMCLL